MKEIPLNSSIRLISPRVFAVITSQAKDGKTNAAPYSYLYALSHEPALLMVGFGKGKLTAKNILATKEFAVNFVSSDFGQKAVNTEAKDCAFWEKIEKSGLHLEKSKKINVPRIKESKAVLECILHQKIKIKNSDHEFIVGKVVHAEAEFLDEQGFPDLDKLDYLMHANQTEFRKIGKRIDLNRKK